MKKKYIKLNTSDNYLCIGNFCRVLKDNAVNKSAALQSELFCLLFNVDSVNDTTINNYCIGYRKIGDNYKQIYLNKKKEYQKDKYSFIPIINNIISVLDGKIYLNDDNKISYEIINSNSSLKKLCTKLYNIAKNDKNVNISFSNTLHDLINNNKLYECIIEILFYVILEFKQPIYIEDIKKNSIEKLLENTNISSNDLLEYLNLRYSDGANYNYKLRKLAENGNAYAAYELGEDEYLGYVTGKPRYNIAYNYFKIASDSGHPSATYLMAKMYYKNNIGTGSNDDLEKAFNLYNKAKELGSIASVNSIGIFYLNGLYPVKKDFNKALECFNKAASYDYVYAYNNLGLIYEGKKDFNKALEYFIKSANLGESWACNKVAEYYRLGLGTDKDLSKSFKYYNKGLDTPIKYLNYYNNYNLGKYFYFVGCPEINLEKDIDKAVELITQASDNNIIEASTFLFYYYIDLYLKNKNKNTLDNIYKYKNKIETNNKYNNELKNEIQNKLKDIYNKDIDISIIL